MTNIRNLLFSVSLFVCSVYADVPFITKCLSTDTACLKRSAQAALPVIAAGIPEMNVQPLDPLHIDHVDASSENLKLTNTDIVITGLRNCIVENIERNIATSKIIFGAVCDIEYKSKYDVHGQVLVVAIEGKGDMTVKIKKVYLNVESDITLKTDKHGQKHWFIKSYKYNYELRGNTEIAATHLFDGNEVLDQAARELLAKSSNEVILEVGPPILKAVVEKIIKTINKFSHSVAAEDLAIDSF